MTHTTNQVDELLTRYLAMYNDSDAERRRAAVEELWTADGVLANSACRYQGHDEIADGVRRSHDHWVGSGHVFRPAGTASVHHGTVRFVWHMYLDESRPPVSVGTNFMVLNDSGKLASDHQFVES